MAIFSTSSQYPYPLDPAERAHWQRSGRYLPPLPTVASQISRASRPALLGWLSNCYRYGWSYSSLAVLGSGLLLILLPPQWAGYAGAQPQPLLGVVSQLPPEATDPALNPERSLSPETPSTAHTEGSTPTTEVESPAPPAGAVPPPRMEPVHPTHTIGISSEEALTAMVEMLRRQAMRLVAMEVTPAPDRDTNTTAAPRRREPSAAWQGVPGRDRRGEDWNRADLFQQGFENSNLFEGNFQWANLYAALLTGVNGFASSLQGANLYASQLTGANFYGSDLREANLYKADLQEANLYRADLTGANLFGANLFGANLTGANLHNTTLEGSLLCQTVLPGGEVSNRDCDR